MAVFNATLLDLQSVLNAAAEGDTVQLAAGTYKPNTDTAATDAAFATPPAGNSATRFSNDRGTYYIKAPVRLLGHPDGTTFDGMGADGVTIGRTAKECISTRLGALPSSTAARTQIRNITVQNYFGKGIYADTNIFISDCTVTDIYDETLTWAAGAAQVSGEKGIEINRPTLASVRNPDGSVVRRCTVRRCGEIGIGVNRSDNVEVSNCTIIDNNFKARSRRDSAAGLKAVDVSGFKCFGNWFKGNDCKQLWIDVNSGERATNLVNDNYLEAPKTSTDSTQYNIFYEISMNAIITRNVSFGGYCGIQITSSHSVRVYNNTVIDPYWQGIYVVEDPVRTVDVARGTSDQRVHDNVIRNNAIVGQGNSVFLYQQGGRTQGVTLDNTLTPPAQTDATRLIDAQIMVPFIDHNAYACAASTSSFKHYAYRQGSAYNFNVGNAVANMRTLTNASLAAGTLEAGSLPDLPGTSGNGLPVAAQSGTMTLETNPYVDVVTCKRKDPLRNQGAPVPADVAACSALGGLPPLNTTGVNHIGAM